MEERTAGEEGKVRFELGIPAVVRDRLVPERRRGVALHVGHDAVDDGGDPGERQGHDDQPLAPVRLVDGRDGADDAHHQQGDGELGGGVREGGDELDDVVDIGDLLRVGARRRQVVDMTESSEQGIVGDEGAPEDEDALVTVSLPSIDLYLLQKA